MKFLGSFRLLLVVLVALLASSFAREFQHSSGYGATVSDVSLSVLWNAVEKIKLTLCATCFPTYLLCIYDDDHRKRISLPIGRNEKYNWKSCWKRHVKPWRAMKREENFSTTTSSLAWSERSVPTRESSRPCREKWTNGRSNECSSEKNFAMKGMPRDVRNDDSERPSYNKKKNFWHYPLAGEQIFAAPLQSTGRLQIILSIYQNADR